MKVKSLKSQNGYAGTDALMAIFIIALFATFIATVSYNIYLTNSSIKRTSTATNYIVDVFEYANKVPYEDVTTEQIVNYFNNKYYYEEDGQTVRKSANAIAKKGSNEIVNTPYQVIINVTNYNETEGNNDKLDVIKQITVSVNYKVGNKDQSIEMYTIIKK